MRLDDIYEHYGKSWVKVMREIGVGSSTLTLWRKNGFIPANSQIKLEKRLNGLFRADLDDAQPPSKKEEGIDEHGYE